MKRQALALVLICSLMFAGCWDRVEVEDQLFVVALGVDQGSKLPYRVTAYVPIPSQVQAGVLGGQGTASQMSGLLAAEADSVSQAIYAINGSLTRRITLRQLRLLVVGEDLARAGLDQLYSELMRNHEVRETAGFLVARGKAGEVLKRARFTGEANPARIGEGVLLVEKHLHLSPPIRLHHMTNRAAALGVDPFSGVAALNQQMAGGEQDVPESAVAGHLARLSGNPVEIAGTALFQDTRLKGYLTVDETQALLAMRGEMGKAYVTIPNPLDPDGRVMLRLGQENKPKSQVTITKSGPRVRTRLIFEAEVISGDENYRNPEVRQKVEAAARAHMEGEIRSVLEKARQWDVDPVGFGLLFRGRFRTWDEWAQFNWREQLPKLSVQVEATTRIRRVGLVLGTERVFEDK